MEFIACIFLSFHIMIFLLSENNLITAMKPYPHTRGSPHDKSWEEYHPTHTSKCAPPYVKHPQWLSGLPTTNVILTR